MQVAVMGQAFGLSYYFLLTSVNYQSPTSDGDMKPVWLGCCGHCYSCQLSDSTEKQQRCFLIFLKDREEDQERETEGRWNKSWELKGRRKKKKRRDRKAWRKRKREKEKGREGAKEETKEGEGGKPETFYFFSSWELLSGSFLPNIMKGSPPMIWFCLSY